MIRRAYFRAVSLLVIFTCVAVSAQAATYTIDATHSNVGFTIRHIVSRVSGGFPGVTGTIDYDPDHPEMSAVTARIDVSTIDTNNKNRDEHLKGTDFFDAKTYGTISFKSTGAAKKGDRLMVTGDLTMHGVTQRIVLPVEVLGVGVHPRSKAAVAGFSAQTVLKRSDFGVNSWTDVAGVLSDEVTVTLNVEAVVTPPAEPAAPKDASAK